MKRTLFAAALAIALAGCCSCSDQAVKLAGGDSGGEAELVLGQTLEVALAENPTTGYRWEWKGDASHVLEQTGEKQFVVDSAAIGAGGVMTMRFNAAAVGQTELKLVYRRPFEKGVPPIETYRVQVTVRAK